MRKEYLIALVVLALAGIGAFVLMGRNQSSQSPNLAPDTTQESLPATDNTVVYTNSGYSPPELIVEVGTTVTFINESDLPMWTASDPHPVHTDYSAFDGRRGVGRGETYQFTFEEPGTYEYHNHLSPQHTGTIIVE